MQHNSLPENGAWLQVYSVRKQQHILAIGGLSGSSTCEASCVTVDHGLECGLENGATGRVRRWGTVSVCQSLLQLVYLVVYPRLVKVSLLVRAQISGVLNLIFFLLTCEKYGLADQGISY
jgi:hypothetical protein